MEFWKKEICQTQEIYYAISRNFHFWNVSIRTFYQKLWLFEVFFIQKILKP